MSEMLETIELDFAGGAVRRVSGDGVTAPADPARAGGSVIWLHGLGADGADFEPIVPELGLDPSLHVRFVFPHAPHRAVTINNGFVMRAWYDIYSLDRLNHQDTAGMAVSAEQVDALIEREIARGVPAARIVLAGFSQGGVIAYFAGLRRTTPLAGIVALSCYLPFSGSLADALPAAAAGSPPVFAAHGQLDPTIPVALGEGARDVLTARGYNVAWKSYAMGHSVCMEEVLAIGAFLTRVLRHAD
jgi:phospholipase/carboxylesterase